MAASSSFELYVAKNTGTDMNINNQNLKLGSTILAVGYVGLLAASIAIVSSGANPDSAIGRHLWAGSLANASLCAVEILVITHSLRKGEKWAWWAAAVPLIVYGIPILILDALHVPSERLFLTLAPQVLGMVAAGVGLTLTARVAIPPDCFQK
jgi:lysylphosphatidylglycerol synthetase-like protein (DUF2156 family)